VLLRDLVPLEPSARKLGAERKTPASCDTVARETIAYVDRACGQGPRGHHEKQALRLALRW